jgi:diacylglycerol kinase family enzyme
MSTGTTGQRWLARTSLAAVVLAALVLVGFALDGGLLLMLVAAALVALMAASAYWFLAERGLRRWVALAVLIACPIVVIVLLVQDHLVWVLLVAVGLVLVAAGTGRAALDRDRRPYRMPEYDAPRPRNPFIVMNPRSGGGKVTKFGLVDKAKALGAEVALLEGPGEVDVEALARDAVARGADLLGVAGGDGTQALVAGVAAEHDLPFLVISAGTRNHFALDLGLDRTDPSTCLEALTDDAVELRVDLGVVGDRTFVNNASFGAYASVVQSPAYRNDKTRTTLEVLPDLLSGHDGPRLVLQAPGVTVAGPQAVLVSDNPYALDDLVGIGHRTRLDRGVLGAVAVSVDDARQAVGLLRNLKARGLTILEADEVLITADAPEIPAGIDGEAILVPTPVRCAIRPQALRVRVPRRRLPIRPRRPRWNWARLRQLAGLQRGDSRR